jgi:hypothetical protein
MARKVRVEHAGAVYHVINRNNRREAIATAKQPARNGKYDNIKNRPLY